MKLTRITGAFNGQEAIGDESPCLHSLERHLTIDNRRQSVAEPLLRRLDTGRRGWVALIFLMRSLKLSG
jgi:hypothetical protein